MFQQRAEDRLRSWREFRDSLESDPTQIAMIKIAEFWSGAPFVPYYLDSEDPESWPDPWTLINENVYCDVAKCLGILYTVSLTTHRKDIDIEFRQYEDPKNRFVYNLAWIDQGKYIINMIDGEVVNIEQFDKTLKLKKRYTDKELQLQNY